MNSFADLPHSEQISKELYGQCKMADRIRYIAYSTSKLHECYSLMVRMDICFNMVCETMFSNEVLFFIDQFLYMWDTARIEEKTSLISNFIPPGWLDVLLKGHVPVNIYAIIDDPLVYLLSIYKATGLGDDLNSYVEL